MNAMGEVWRQMWLKEETINIDFGWKIYCSQSWFWFFCVSGAFYCRIIIKTSRECVNIFVKTSYNLDTYYLYCWLFSTTLHNIIVFLMIYLVRNSTAVSLMFRLDSLAFKESFITSSEKILVIYCLLFMSKHHVETNHNHHNHHYHHYHHYDHHHHHYHPQEWKP